MTSFPILIYYAPFKTLIHNVVIVYRSLLRKATDFNAKRSKYETTFEASRAAKDSKFAALLQIKPCIQREVDIDKEKCRARVNGGHARELTVFLADCSLNSHSPYDLLPQRSSPRMSENGTSTRGAASGARCGRATSATLCASRLVRRSS